jgi:glutamine synthetase
VVSEGAGSIGPGGARAEAAREAAARAESDGVRVVLLSFVDNAGVTRARAIPLRLFERAATWGVGLSSAWYTVTATDAVTSSPYVGNPAGDIRLVPDPGALRPLAAQPGWAWAPTDQFNQDGSPYPCCARSYLRRMAGRAAESDLTLKVGFELEWFMAETARGPAVPAHDGPAVGAQALIRVSAFVGDLIDALDRQEVGLEAINGEYSDGQLELSFAPKDPVAAADASVLTRLTIHALSARHGYRCSFSPAFAGPMGNGGHVHLSVWRQGENLFAGGDGPHGMAAAGAAFLAGLLGELPAMTAIGAPCAASYLRLLPSRWAGVYQCWGLENREAAVRFITGMAGAGAGAANIEVKCFDEAANPYLLLGAFVAAGTAGVDENRRLPAEYTGDPGADDPAALARLGIRRLPATLDEAIEQMRGSKLLLDTMGPALHDAFLAVRSAEADQFRGSADEKIISAYRWRF